MKTVAGMILLWLLFCFFCFSYSFFQKNFLFLFDRVFQKDASGQRVSRSADVHRGRKGKSAARMPDKRNFGKNRRSGMETSDGRTGLPGKNQRHTK